MGSFSEIEYSLKNLPPTWYPKLVQTVTLEAIKAGVFLPGGATEFVRKIEASVVEVTTTNETT